MKISTPLKEFFRYESGAVHDEFLNIPLRFHNGLASRDLFSLYCGGPADGDLRQFGETETQFCTVHSVLNYCML